MGEPVAPGDVADREVPAVGGAQPVVHLDSPASVEPDAVRFKAETV